MKAPTDIWEAFSGHVNFFENDFGRSMLNTFFVSITSVAGGLLINSMAGFAFAQFRFKGDNIIFGFVLLSFVCGRCTLALMVRRGTRRHRLVRCSPEIRDHLFFS